ncbi:MAG: cytochrome C [Alphaproteobacteria bacterium HGW-Alphaproteobacteria-2]|nr:MAG: cytochrome C [Alphaproteobacteria bacterium HGW-Alphaproteobacteria-2]
MKWAALAAGAAVFVSACGNCHTPMGPDGPIADQELSGRFVISFPEFDAWSPNITPATIGGWTDQEIARAIREGIRPDGRVLGPPMAFELYRHISDEDIAAIIAYLRALPPVENEVPRSVYRIPLPDSYGPPVGEVTAPEPGETVEYGAYLAGPVAHCIECHTPMEGPRHLYDTRLGAGGRDMSGPWGPSISANLTPAPHALARWSDDEVIAMIRTGHRPDGSAMLPPMAYGFYAGMSDRDARAIVAYLRSLPPRD